MVNTNLQMYSTKQLVEELQKRQGTNCIIINPNEKYKIISSQPNYEDIGPAVILIILD